jgi:hypothetical protein
LYFRGEITHFGEGISFGITSAQPHARLISGPSDRVAKGMSRLRRLDTLRGSECLEQRASKSLQRFSTAHFTCVSSSASSLILALAPLPSPAINRALRVIVSRAKIPSAEGRPGGSEPSIDPGSKRSRLTAAFLSISGYLKGVSLPVVLVVADFLHPLDDLTVELFLNGDMGHSHGWRSTMPVLLTRRKPNHIAGMDLLDGNAFMLCSTATAGDNQGLTQRMGVPCCSSAGLEGDTGARRAGRCACLEQRIYTHCR